MSIPGPARRVLHVCWCCDDADEVEDLMVAGLGLRPVMRTDGRPADGAVLGFAGRTIRSVGDFVTDARGPRVAPMIEIQAWIDPPPRGRPGDDPFAVGIRALGVTVADVDAAAAGLVARGGRVASRDESTGRTVVVEPGGVTLDLDPPAASGTRETRLAHLRVTVTDLAASRSFAERLGFVVIGDDPVDDGRSVGVPGPVRGRRLRLRVAEEPFELHLHAWADPPATGRHPAPANQRGLYRAALRVDDLDAALAAVTAAGVAVTRGPLSVPMPGTGLPDLRVAFVTDPDGVPYEFVERPAAVFR
ncbi:MAG: VOC family protein [Actinomyces sp.]|nr:MAG: VOC family protein [Actinomyces sp.]